jgi:nicotinamidase-related amidase
MSTWRDVMPLGDYGAFSADPFTAADLGERPVLLVVDVVRAFLGDEDVSPEESRARWPLSCGPSGWAALPRIEELVTAARAGGVPIVYTKMDDVTLGGATRASVERRTPRPEAQVVLPSVAPRTDDVVLSKCRPSAFFGTPLSALLVRLRADSVVIAGCTTSGCVRATAVDAYSMGWRVVLAEDGCFDRAQLSHDVSLFELNAKYASVVPVSDLGPALAGVGDLDTAARH